MDSKVSLSFLIYWNTCTQIIGNKTELQPMWFFLLQQTQLTKLDRLQSEESSQMIFVKELNFLNN